MENSMGDRLKEIYGYRHMFFGLVKKDFKGHYRNSALGYLWHLITPLSMLLVFIVVFTAILGKGIESYWIYLSVGIFPWTLFSSSLSESTGSIVREAGIVTKMNFPREILVLTAVTTNLINFVISYSILTVAIVISGHALNAFSLLLIPVVIILEIIFAIGLGLFFSALNVYHRDVSHGVGILTLLWMWVTPIIYMSNIDSLLSTINSLNPMTYFIESLHKILYWGDWPDPMHILACTIFAFTSLIVGMMVFKKLERGFSERL